MMNLRRIQLSLLISLIVIAATACTPTAPSTTAPSTTAPDTGTTSTSEPVDEAGDPGRDAYMEIDPATEPFATHQQEYQTAFASGETWTQDVTTVAGNLAGTNQYEAVSILEQSDTNVVYLVSQTIEEDDSLAEQQFRIELTRSASTDPWTVAWMGARWKCRPGRGHEDWSPELCV